MSLLMDALRKAEADKKAAAARAAGQAQPSAEIDHFALTAEELRLEPLGDIADANLGGTRSGEYTHSLGGLNPRLGIGGRFRTMGDATLAEDLSFARPPLTTSSTSNEAGDNGSLTRPELVTPSTVFAASARPANPLALGLGAVVLLLFGAVGLLGYRYYSKAPPPLVIPSPRVALGVEKGAAPRLPRVIPAPAATTSIPPVASSAAAPAVEIAVMAADESVPNTSVHTDMQRVAATSATPVLAAAPPLQAPRATLPQDVEMRNGDLHIARTARAPDLTRRLTLAYSAFERGDLALARHEYAAVLQQLPSQRDALLGLGAIALSENRLPEAHTHYSAVLAETPDQPVANAALFLIEGGRGTRASEAKLKMLLDRSRDAPYLLFALGNLYAREQRWGDAQQAYFAAFRAQPRNADYAFNLAVSLDQLGQRRAALDYYRQAEALRGPNTAFDGATVAARIATLATHSSP